MKIGDFALATRNFGQVRRRAAGIGALIVAMLTTGTVATAAHAQSTDYTQDSYRLMAESSANAHETFRIFIVVCGIAFVAWLAFQRQSQNGYNTSSKDPRWSIRQYVLISLGVTTLSLILADLLGLPIKLWLFGDGG